MQPGAPKKETSPWVYVGCGCAGLVVLAMIAFAVMTWLFYREGKEFEKAWTDPKAREAKAREVVGWSELPEGYYPVGSFSIPFVMDFALFTDEPPVEGAKPDSENPSGNFKDRGFVFISMRSFGGRGRELQDFMQGKGKKPEWLESDAEFKSGELIRRGSVEVNGQPVLYSATRGEFNRDGKNREGITTLLGIDCPGSNRVRMGVWFGPDPHKDKPIAESDYTGTNADPKEIAAFASHFRFCPGADQPAR